MLSDRALKRHMLCGDMAIEPFEEARLSGASYDLSLHPRILVVDKAVKEIDLAMVGHYVEPLDMDDEMGYLLGVNEFILASTIERVTISPRFWSRVEGKSSLGRVGLAVHVTAGFVDPGWDGGITLEVVNLLGIPIRIYPRQLVAQVCFGYMSDHVDRPYDQTGHYQGQEGPTASRFRIEGRVSLEKTLYEGNWTDEFCEFPSLDRDSRCIKRPDHKGRHEYA